MFQADRIRSSLESDMSRFRWLLAARLRRPWLRLHKWGFHEAEAIHKAPALSRARHRLRDLPTDACRHRALLARTMPSGQHVQLWSKTPLLTF